jgi:RES domain
MTDRPYPLPDINTRQPRVATIQNVTFHRFYSRGHKPIFFDRSNAGRLNSPDGSFGVLYAAEQMTGAFAETFLRSPGRHLLLISPFPVRISVMEVRLFQSHSISFVPVQMLWITAHFFTVTVTR